MPEFDALVATIVNSGVTIVVIAYFMIRDFKFQSSLVTTLQSLVDTVETLKEVISTKTTTNI